MSKKFVFKVAIEEGSKMPLRANDDNENIGYDVIMWKIKFEGCLKTNPNLPAVISVDTGVRVQPVSDDCYIEAVPNSRISKKSFVLGNSTGVIDRNYTGTVIFIFNVLETATEEEIKEFFKVGNMAGQFIVREKCNAEFIKVNELDPTSRGEGGFGSTAK